MSLVQTIANSNPGIEPLTLRFEQWKRRRLDRSATTPTYSNAEKKNDSQPITFTKRLNTPRPRGLAVVFSDAEA